MEYRAVVLPSETWMRDETKETLARFERAGGIVAHGVAGLAKVPRTLGIAGEGARAIRVMKRVDGDGRIWFLVNEDMKPRNVEIAFPHGAPIVRYNSETDATEGVAVDANGVLRRTFGPGETAIYVTGSVFGDAVYSRTEWQEAALPVSGWTLRPLVSHIAGKEDFEIRPCDVPAQPVALGDWRGILGGTFSGKAFYRAEFDSPDGGGAILDLGEVKWCASVRLNGEDLGGRFFGPFRWNVRLAKGRNVLEVTVANLLANQVGDNAIRDRILRDWQPNGAYDSHMRPFDKDNHESGLYGPVRVTLGDGCALPGNGNSGSGK